MSHNTDPSLGRAPESEDAKPETAAKRWRGAVVLGETVIMHEVMSVTPEAGRENLEALAAAYVPLPRTVTVVEGCGDDRQPTDESAAELARLHGEAPIANPGTEGYIRGYGGHYGRVEALHTAMVAQHGPEVAKSLPDFQTAAAEQAASTFVATDGLVIPGVHVGCAAGEKIGALSKDIASDPTVQAAAQRDLDRVFGDEALIPTAAELAEATQLAADATFGEQPAAFSLPPQEFTIGQDENGQPLGSAIMKLEGAHAPASQTVCVLNLDPRSISVPGKAIQEWGQVYDVDATITAEIIMRSNPDRDLDPNVLLPALVNRATYVRAALAGGNPDDLPLVVRGDAAAALAYLDNLRQGLLTGTAQSWSQAA